MGQLDGKVALITGASKGIGRVMSQLFAQEGASVICAARSRDLVEETAGLVKAAGGRALAVIGDAAAEGDVKNMVERGVKAFGRLDVLVNNAGDGGPTKRVQDYTTEDWFYTINSCLTSSYLCTRFAVPEMIKAGGGAIVIITSTAGRRGLPFRIGYCSAKAGQVGMTYGMALELAPHNIRVNAIAPGAVAGDRIDRVIAGQAEVRGVAVDERPPHLVDRRRHRDARGLPLQRGGQEPFRAVHRSDRGRTGGLTGAGGWTIPPGPAVVRFRVDDPPPLAQLLACGPDRGPPGRAPYHGVRGPGRPFVDRRLLRRGRLRRRRVPDRQHQRGRGHPAHPAGDAAPRAGRHRGRPYRAAAPRRFSVPLHPRSPSSVRSARLTASGRDGSRTAVAHVRRH